MKLKLLSSLAVFLPITNLYALSLDEAFSMSNKSEVVKIATLNYERALNNQDSVTGGVLPTVTLNAKYGRDEYRSDYSTKNSSSDKDLYLNLNQPLYRGLREFNAIKVQRLLTESKKYLNDNVTRTLKSQVAAQFFNILSLQKEMEFNNQLLKASQDRVKEVSERVRIGKSKKSDLFSSKSQLMVVQNQIEDNKTKLQLAFIELSDLLATEVKEQKLNYREENIDKSLSLGSSNQLNNHPIILNYNLLKEIAGLNLKSAKAAHQPTLDLKGNYYFGDDGFNNTKNWDASINLSFPLYEGGKTNAAIRDSALSVTEVEFNSSLAKRNLENEVKSLVRELSQLQIKDNILKETKEALKVSYNEIKKEYSLGLLTNLEVISSLNQYIDAEKNYYKNIFEMQKLAHQLNIIVE